MSSSDSEENYETEFVNLKFNAGWNLLKDSYFGPAIQLQSREYTDLTEAGSLRRYLAVNDEEAESTRVGLGVQLKRDTRDNTFYTQKGVFSELELLAFDKDWGSDYNFNLFALEHRRFIPLDSRSVFAVQAKINAASGHVPYDQLPAIGGAQSLRGVLQDRFKDDFALSS
ncbi:BamA/TamA family outer membrane protein, partial [Oceanospirillum sp. HFRX-1_2]